MTQNPWEPPLAGGEQEQLVAALERLRTIFRWKADGLGPDGLRLRAGRSALTLGGLLKHLALVEDIQFGEKYDGTPPGEPWSAVDWDAEVAVFTVDGEELRRCPRPPTYPMQLMVAVFDFPDDSTGDDDHLVPRLVVDHVAGW